MKFRENSVQICLIVQLFITIVELHLVLRQPDKLDMTNASNPVLKIGEYQMPIDKNILIKNGTPPELEGIVTYAPETGRIYIPAEAVPLIKGTKH
jgi:hypothetical protein